MDPIITIAKTSALQELLDAPEWDYCGGTMCEPAIDEIRLPGSVKGLTAWAVYDLLDLDVRQVCQIYRMDDFFVGLGRRKVGLAFSPNEPESGFYQILKFRSSYWSDFESWMTLARLTGRRIAFHREFPRPRSPATGLVALFHPDGRIDESPSFLRNLSETRSFQTYLLYKAGLPGVRIART